MEDDIFGLHEVQTFQEAFKVTIFYDKMVIFMEKNLWSYHMCPCSKDKGRNKQLTSHLNEKKSVCFIATKS